MEKFVKSLLLIVFEIVLFVLSLLLFEEHKVPALLIICGMLIQLICGYIYKLFDL